VPVPAVLVLAITAALVGQLASRPVEEWRKLLDAPDRVAALRVDETIAKLKLRPDDIVADLGAGTGPFVVPFAKAVPSGTVYAVDVDSGFLPIIDAKVKAAGVGNARSVLGAFGDPKLPASVDVAFMHDVLHHIADRPGYLKALAKYLKPDARVAIIDYDPARSPHRDQPALVVSKDDARRLLAEIGFTNVEDIPLFDDKWFVVFRR
jgi:ubiquinone/menaquinone biosynthesis C-methylase UbiE